MTSANIGYIGQTKKDVLATCTIFAQTEMTFALTEKGKKDEAMNKCDNCKCNKVCDHDRFGFENCDNYISEDCAEVVRCRDCIHGRKIDILFSDEFYKEDCVSCECKDTVGDEPMIYPPTHYCSYGERWKDDKD